MNNHIAVGGLRCLAVALPVGALIFLAVPAIGGEVNVTDGLAIAGYDPVGYFVNGKALKGSPEITYEAGGAVYQFVSAENRQAFIANPEKYLPQYDGHCAYGASQGYKAAIDPEAFTIVDGKLYLNYSAGVQSEWRSDVKGYISQANTNWQALDPR